MVLRGCRGLQGEMNGVTGVKGLEGRFVTVSDRFKKALEMLVVVVSNGFKELQGFSGGFGSVISVFQRISRGF